MTGGFGGIGGFGGPIPRDLIAILATLLVTFSLQFFSATALLPALLRLTPLAWQKGFFWQLATYPFVGAGTPGIWFLLGLLFLYWFGRDVFAGLGRRHFWRLVMLAAVLSAVLAVAVDALGGGSAASFTLMQGQWMLMSIFVAAFATANPRATILLFFILPIEARWFLGLEILFAFMGFLSTKDLPGFLGICAAVGITYTYVRSGGRWKGLREIRLRMERWWLSRKLDRAKKKRNLRVIPGERRDPPRGRDPWVH